MTPSREEETQCYDEVQIGTALQSMGIQIGDKVVVGDVKVRIHNQGKRKGWDSSWAIFEILILDINILTRKHSSRVRTARLLTRRRIMLSRGGGPVQEGGGYCQGRMLSITGSDIITPPAPRGQTDACENITLTQTSFTGGNNN